MNNMAATTNLTQFEATIAAVKTKFLGVLEQQQDELSQLLHRVETATDVPAALTRASQIAHRIHGVARTLGFSDLGVVAAVAEQATENLDPNQISPQQIEDASQKIADLINGIYNIRVEAGLG